MNMSRQTTPHEPRMGESTTSPPTDIPTARARVIGIYLFPTAAFCLALAATLLCRAASGSLHGMFFGGITFAAILAPPLVLAERPLGRQALVAGCMWFGTTLAWTAVPLDVNGTAGLWWRASLLLATFILALWGVAALLGRLRLGHTGAAAVATLLALAWLAWPVWLSPALPGHQRLTDALTRPHPLLTLDTPLLSPWAESWTVRPYFYGRLGNLNQDVQYHPPAGVGPALFLHATVGILCLAGARWRTWGRRGVGT